MAKLTEEDILSIGWELSGQLEYITGEWTLESANNDRWRINDEDHQMMWFTITTLDELITIMNFIGIKIYLNTLDERIDDIEQFDSSNSKLITSLKHLKHNWRDYKFMSDEAR